MNEGDNIRKEQSITGKEDIGYTEMGASGRRGGALTRYY